MEVRDSLDNVIGQYAYDGDGKRIKKYVPSTDELTVFVYDAGGKLIGEYSTVTPPSEPKVAYLTNDHLGSPRINTDQNGVVIARHDYQPFGEEIFSTDRITALGYTADTVRKQFTGYERDNETDLDFAQARYFASGFGRFSTPDNFLNDTRTSDPKSWNLYVYVRNNPLKLVDPNGEKIYVGDITDSEDREKYLSRLNATYGCDSCVRIDDNGYLELDTTGLSQEMLEATEFLTEAINSTSEMFQVRMANSSSTVLFGRGIRNGGGVPLIGPDGTPITDSSGAEMRRNAHLILLDFDDDDLLVGGSLADRTSFLDFIFAHEVRHFSPSFTRDPDANNASLRGDVVNSINRIRALQHRPLRAVYVNRPLGFMNSLRFGDAGRNPDGSFIEGNDGIEVENTRMILWFRRQRPNR